MDLLFKYVASDDMWRRPQPPSTYCEYSNQVFAEPVFHRSDGLLATEREGWPDAATPPSEQRRTQSE
jgi:hypothetical protein